MACEKSCELSGTVEDTEELLQSLLDDETKFKKTIFKLFESQYDPYQYLLQFVPLAKLSEKNKQKNDLLHEIFSSFVAWTETLLKNLVQPSAALQTTALQRAMNFRNRDVLVAISRIFKIDGEKHLHIIEEHFEKGNIAMVAHAVKLYNLHENYDFETLYFPLLCFDMKRELRNCLSQSKGLRLQFVENLDKLLRRKKELDEAIKSVQDKFPKRKSIKKEMKYYKKAMHGFIKEWNIPLEKCVNFMMDKKCVAMYHLVCRYKKKEISRQALAELTIIITGKDKDLVPVMIRKLKFDPIISEIVSFKLKNPSKPWPTNFDVVKFSNEFLNLSLDASQIIFVNDRVTYERSVRDISKCKEIGFDAEWQPTFGWSTEKIALLQIATWDNIYLFDVLSLSKCLSNKWGSLVKKVLHNNNILKVGYGTETDLEIFKETFMSNSEDVDKKFENFLDLRNFSSWVSKLHPEIIQNLGSVNGNTEHCDNSDCGAKSCIQSGGNEKSSNQNSGNTKSPNQSSGDTKISDRNGDKSKSSNQNGGNATSSGGKGAKAKKRAAKKNRQTRGLSGLCLLVLGKPLNKSEQMSDWEQRPLRKAQMLYAALDAFCLLQILERLEYVLHRMGLNKLDMIENFFKSSAEEKDKEKSEAGEPKISKKKTSNASASSSSSSSEADESPSETT